MASLGYAYVIRRLGRMSTTASTSRGRDITMAVDEEGGGRWREVEGGRGRRLR
jgi:hypothetical protein